MCKRMTTPYNDGPSKEYLESLVSDKSKGEDVQIRKSKSKKRRSRNKSMSEEIEKAAEIRRKTERHISIGSMSGMSEEEGEEIQPSGQPQSQVFIIVWNIRDIQQTVYC